MLPNAVLDAMTGLTTPPVAASPLRDLASPIMAIFGGISSGFGTYFAAKSAKSNLRFQADMAALNARLAEKNAQAILQAGEQAIGTVTMRAGKVKSSQRAGQGARGIAIGEGSAAEEIATTDLMKETDAYTINANAVRQAASARMQAVNYQNESLLRGTTADSISLFATMIPSLLDSATTVASSWYQNRRKNRIADLFGGD